jgi:hypothetical protein
MRAGRIGQADNERMLGAVQRRGRLSTDLADTGSRGVWPERPSIVGYGHYPERWVLREGQWKLAAQRLTRLHVDVLPPAVN